MPHASVSPHQVDAALRPSFLGVEIHPHVVVVGHELAERQQVLTPRFAEWCHAFVGGDDPDDERVVGDVEQVPTGGAVDGCVRSERVGVDCVRGVHVLDVGPVEHL
jgi:hypothetical protein